MKDDIEQRVRDFVAEMTATDSDQITLETTLVGEFKLAGADGWELIDAFGERFAVDLSDFDYSEHFGEEGVGCLFFPLVLIKLFRYFILNEDPHKVCGLRPITIRELVAAAERKRWSND